MLISSYRCPSGARPGEIITFGLSLSSLPSLIMNSLGNMKILQLLKLFWTIKGNNNAFIRKMNYIFASFTPA